MVCPTAPEPLGQRPDSSGKALPGLDQVLPKYSAELRLMGLRGREGQSSPRGACPVSSSLLSELCSLF